MFYVVYKFISALERFRSSNGGYLSAVTCIGDTGLEPISRASEARVLSHCTNRQNTTDDGAALAVCREPRSRQIQSGNPTEVATPGEHPHSPRRTTVATPTPREAKSFMSPLATLPDSRASSGRQ